MNQQDLKIIKETIKYLLEEGVFENLETAYNTATNSIDTLEQAIEVMGCCTELPSFLTSRNGGVFVNTMEDAEVTERWLEWLEKTR